MYTTVSHFEIPTSDIHLIIMKFIAVTKKSQLMLNLKIAAFNRFY